MRGNAVSIGIRSTIQTQFAPLLTFKEEIQNLNDLQQEVGHLREVQFRREDIESAFQSWISTNIVINIVHIDLVHILNYALGLILTKMRDALCTTPIVINFIRVEMGNSASSFNRN